MHPTINDELDPIPNLLDTAEEYIVGSESDVLRSQRQYHYTDTRLDKVSVRNTGNYHTLHDYVYDDEDDEGFTALDLERPKLRREYICDINLAEVTTEKCRRTAINNEDDPSLNVFEAAEIVTYIYNENGYLYRKEFDIKMKI